MLDDAERRVNTSARCSLLMFPDDKKNATAVTHNTVQHSHSASAIVICCLPYGWREQKIFQTPHARRSYYFPRAAIVYAMPARAYTP